MAAQPRAFSQQIPREVLGRWKGGSISEDRKEGKREDGRLDLPLRLVAPEGPADTNNKNHDSKHNNDKNDI